MFRITSLVCILEEVDISYTFSFIFWDLLTFITPLWSNVFFGFCSFFRKHQPIIFFQRKKFLDFRMSGLRFKSWIDSSVEYLRYRVSLWSWALKWFFFYSSLNCKAYSTTENRVVTTIMSIKRRFVLKIAQSMFC